MPTIWTVERTASARFPYRIAISDDTAAILAVRAQSPWPGPGQQVFCVRERTLDPTEPLEPVERVPVSHLTRIGRKLTVALDRGSRKRCEFLTVTKTRRDGTGSFEQLFFRTESGIRAHRSRTHLELGPSTQLLAIAVDTAERYPWKFPEASVSRRKLAVGDYALLEGGEAVAVVERKSFDNLLSDLGALQALHHQLADLASLPVAALVVEAQLADFLDEKRLRSRWPASFVARAVAEMSALHPKLPIVFTGNRKLANLWTERFFQAITKSRQIPPQLNLLAPQATAECRAPSAECRERGPGLDAAIRAAVLGPLAPEFTMAMLAARFPEVPGTRLTRVVRSLRTAGQVSRRGAGRGSRWVVGG